MKQEKFDYCDPWDRGTYQTGSTNPPKSHNGLTAVLLIAVIFLAGIVSILGIMNIRLFTALNAQNEGTVPLSLYADTDADESSTIIASGAAVGITGEPVTGLYQHYYHLPAGMFITGVAADSDAAVQGVENGDILVSLDGKTVTTNEELTALLDTYSVGDTLQAVLYRDHSQFTVTLTVEEAIG
jgi:membrane-associated protease RseP (regulator of RpoE activity)